MQSKQTREEFERILTDWYKNNPSIVVEKDGKFSRVQLSTDPAAIKSRVDDTIDNIIGIKDILDPEAGYYGAGKSKHFKHRLVDIPNALVLDFIQTNPIAVMKAYVPSVLELVMSFLDSLMGHLLTIY